MGIKSLKKIVYLAAFIRSTAIGFISIFLGFYLVEKGISPFWSGILIAAGLLGNALATSLISFLGVRIGRKTLLLCFSFIRALGGILFPFGTSFVFLSSIAFLGMLNGMGKDRSGVRAIDQTLLADAVLPENRTMTYAHYNMLMDSGLILGAGLAGIPELLTFYHGSLSFGIYGALFAFSGILYGFASIPERGKKERKKLEVRAETKRKIRKLSMIFSLDSLGGGFLTVSLVSYWFFSRFHQPVETVAALFFAARILNLISNYGAVWISKKIGLVKTMVFTHLPASICLILAAFSPYFWLAALFFLIRETFIQMDVPTRESYTMAIVEPHERTYASGMTNAVRNFGWTIPPILAGEGMTLFFQGFPLVAGSSLKIIYDLLLYIQFHHVKPPEEASKK